MNIKIRKELKGHEKPLTGLLTIKHEVIMELRGVSLWALSKESISPEELKSTIEDVINRLDDYFPKLELK